MPRLPHLLLIGRLRFGEMVAGSGAGWGESVKREKSVERDPGIGSLRVLRGQAAPVLERRAASSRVAPPAQPESLRVASLGLELLARPDTLCNGGGGRFCSWAGGVTGPSLLLAGK